MILARTVKSAGVAVAAAMAATSALADVLEIDDGGARWVAGGPAEFELHGAVERPVPGGEGDAIIVPEASAWHVLPRPVSDDEARRRGVPAPYAAKVAELATRYDLSPALIEALVWQESRWRADALSVKGARGLAQLMPATARELGVDPDDPLANLEGGARYLREQLDRFDGDLEKALAAYNAGPGRVERAGGIPQIRETRNYVVAILERLNDHNAKDNP